MEFLRKFWAGWKRVGQAIGDFIGRFVLTIFYFTLFVPFGLGVRFFGDPLDLKDIQKTDWLARTTGDKSVEAGRRLY